MLIDKTTDIAVTSSITYSDPINLTLNDYQGKQIRCSGFVARSSVSGIVSISAHVADESSGASYAVITAGSGNSIQYSGTSISGDNADGQFYFPLTQAFNGTTLPLQNIPFLKIGLSSTLNDVSATLSVIV
jgi:hypothetical protein